MEGLVRLPPEEWYASLPAFLASSAAVITDPVGALLLVKPNYRDHWNLPGGILAADEPPDVCCRREVAEELGLAVELGRLLVVDWVPPTAIRRAWFGFVFDGGTLADRSMVRLQGDELDTCEFVAVPEALERLTANTAGRVAAALRVREGETVAYLCDGGAGPRLGRVPAT
jgi:ADP-ribose pyrophosphatase YjhB (NUDIX family)